MKITNAKYIVDPKTNQNNKINCNVNGEEVCVPLVPGNRHYDEIMRLVEAGELTIQDAE